MTLPLDRELALLQPLTTGQLRQRYLETVGEPTSSHHKTWLMRRILWHRQCLAEGGLSPRARQQAARLAKSAWLRRSAPRTASADVTVLRSGLSHAATTRLRDARLPPAGSLLERAYQGQTLQVSVLEHGFAYQGQVFASLSAVANAITGSHCNGFAFFHLKPPSSRS